jgi:hypothetical protein
MKARRTGLGASAAAIVVLAFPSTAVAANLVPPGNSAASQYTESFPTAGGQQQAGSGSHRGNRSPARALGARNARKLDAQGVEGRAAAEVAAATAPSAAGGGGPGAAHGAGEQAPTPAGGVGGARAGSGLPGGSSGLGEVIAQATGSSSSGELGLLLPLLIAAAVIWSLAFLWRRTRKTAQ